MHGSGGARHECNINVMSTIEFAGAQPFTTLMQRMRANSYAMMARTLDTLPFFTFNVDRPNAVSFALGWDARLPVTYHLCATGIALHASFAQSVDCCHTI